MTNRAPPGYVPCHYNMRSKNKNVTEKNQPNAFNASESRRLIWRTFATETE